MRKLVAVLPRASWEAEAAADEGRGAADVELGANEEEESGAGLVAQSESGAVELGANEKEESGAGPVARSETGAVAQPESAAVAQ